MRKLFARIFPPSSSKMYPTRSHQYPQQSIARMTKSTLNEDLAQPIVVVPPDGGWGWVVTLAAFLISFISDGTAYTFGIFLEDISRSFQVPQTKVAIANSVMTGFYSIIGPISCALINRYGFRKIGFMGGLIAALSFFISSFLNSVETFVLTMGVIGGIGCNFLISPAIIVVGFYFERWRALAVSLTVCGSSLGMIAFPPLFSTIFKNLDWRNKFRVLGGFFSFACLLTLTFKPIKPVKAVPSTGEIKKVQFNSSTSIGTFNEDVTSTRMGIFQKYRNNRFYPTVSQVSFGSNAPYRREFDDQSTFMEIVPSYSANSIKTAGQSTLYTVYEDEEVLRCAILCRKCKECCVNCLCCNCCARKDSETVNRPMYRDDIFFTSSVYFLPQYSRDSNYPGPTAKKSASIAYHMSVTRTATQKDIEEQKRCLCCPEAVRRTFATMLDFSMLKSPSFIMIALSGFFSVLGVFSPFVFIVDRSILQMKIPKDKALMLLSVIGIANTFGRILCGIISFFPLWDVTTLIYVTLMVCGGSLMVSNYLTTFEGQLACVIIFGVTLAGFAALKAIMLVELYGLENLTTCFGLNMLFQGVGCFIGVPICSLLKELTNTYDASFLFSGCCLTLSGILLMPVHKLIVWEKLKRRKVSFRL